MALVLVFAHVGLIVSYMPSSPLSMTCFLSPTCRVHSEGIKVATINQTIDNHRIMIKIRDQVIQER